MTHKSNYIEKAKKAYFLMIALFIPLVRLQIAYNTTLFDFINLGFILFFLTCIFMKGKMQIPLFIPIAVIFIGSLIAMFNAQVPLRNSAALIIDLYLFIFFIVLYNTIETKQELKTFILLWIIFAALQGGFMFQDLLANFSKRALGTFLNQNMASSYLGLSFFLLLQPYVKINKFVTWILGFFILSGILATKSLAGLSGFFIGALAVIILYWYHARILRGKKLISLILIIIIASIVIYPVIAKVPNLLNRFPRAFYSRIYIWQAGLDIFIKNPLGCGIGPAGFKEVGPVIKRYAADAKRRELHNDWLSHLVERGVFGFIGIILLFGAIARMLFKSIKMAASRQELLWATGLGGMFIFILSFSLWHEVLHFRHIWCSFALIAIEYKLRMNAEKEKQLLGIVNK